MAEVADTRPEKRRPDGAAGTSLPGVFGNIFQHRPARPPHPLHAVDGELEAERKCGPPVNGCKSLASPQEIT